MWQERQPRKPYPSDVTDQPWAIVVGDVEARLLRRREHV
jgi:hypothetical protein